MRAGSIGKVLESKNSKFSKGDIVSGWAGVQQYSINNGKGFFKINPGNLDLPVFIGTLGMPGMTAYFGILEEYFGKKLGGYLLSEAIKKSFLLFEIILSLYSFSVY